METLFLFCSAVGGFAFLAQLFLGLGDTDCEDHADGGDDSALNLVSFRGLSAGVLLFGTVGGLVLSNGGGTTGSVLAGLVAGVIANVSTTWIMSRFSRLDSSGSLNLANAIGSYGVVYSTIPPKGTGKITITLQGEQLELPAVCYSHSDNTFRPGETVRVIGVQGDSLIVQRY